MQFLQLAIVSGLATLSSAQTAYSAGTVTMANNGYLGCDVSIVGFLGCTGKKTIDGECFGPSQPDSTQTIKDICGSNTKLEIDYDDQQYNTNKEVSLTFTNSPGQKGTCMMDTKDSDAEWICSLTQSSKREVAFAA